MVSIHAPAKGRPQPSRRSAAALSVSIHAPAKGRRQRFGDSLAVDSVSIHAPAKGRPSSRSPSSSRPGGFNPRPREGATAAMIADAVESITVSIHAPAKGRRRSAASHCRGRAVSIHAPAKGRPPASTARIVPRASFNPRPREGATRRCAALQRLDARFQSTPPRRGDSRIVESEPRLRRVSIHAPAKGRLDAALPGSRESRCFNPRPREGATRIDPMATARALSFNPRPREGATDRARSIRSMLQCFNPRPREGATRRRLDVAEPIARFQSTPPRRGDLGRLGRMVDDRAAFQSTPPRRGDRSAPCASDAVDAVSIHAPAKGRPSIGDRIGHSWPGFNPRPREGATMLAASCIRTRASFNPRPREGATRRPIALTGMVIEFQSTPPRRGDRAGQC